MISWRENADELRQILGRLEATESSGRHLDPDEALNTWRDLTLEVRASGRTIYLIGNGASASMASHVAADLAKNARVHTEVFTDLSLLTAIGNDLSFEEVFAEPLRRRMKQAEMLVTISSSGDSPNVIKAAREAIRLGGQVITLSAMKPENKSRSLGRLNFYVPAQTYGWAETCHAAILHFWVDQMVAATRMH
ncbi:MAG: SIS domain-containing protein [Thermodesulfobacteriota bacterium]